MHYRAEKDARLHLPLLPPQPSHSLAKRGTTRCLCLQSLGKLLNEVPGFPEGLMLFSVNEACRDHVVGAHDCIS